MVLHQKDQNVRSEGGTYGNSILWNEFANNDTPAIRNDARHATERCY